MRFFMRSSPTRRSASWSMRRLVTASILLLAMAGAAHAVQPGRVKTRISSDVVRVQTKAAIAEVRRTPFQLRVLAGRKTLVREQSSGGLFYERSGAVHALGDVRDAHALADGVQLDVETDEGSLATVTLRFLTRRTLEVALDPPDPAGVSAAGERLRSPSTERLYGLTERLRDSPAISPGVLDFARDDIQPPEVGSLDRRGETVEMRIVPTFSVYAPFYQSSLGYGLAVAGTTFGVFDLAKTDPETVSFQFETGTTPATKHLVFRIFV